MTELLLIGYVGRKPSGPSAQSTQDGRSRLFPSCLTSARCISNDDAVT